MSWEKQKEITKIDKDGNESAINISYKIKLIDSTKFMAQIWFIISRRN